MLESHPLPHDSQQLYPFASPTPLPTTFKTSVSHCLTTLLLLFLWTRFHSHNKQSTHPMHDMVSPVHWCCYSYCQWRSSIKSISVLVMKSLGFFQLWSIALLKVDLNLTHFHPVYFGAQSYLWWSLFRFHWLPGYFPLMAGHLSIE